MKARPASLLGAGPERPRTSPSLACATTGFILLLVSCGRPAAPAEGSGVGESDPEQVIGLLTWEITETATGRILGSGHRTLRLKEVSVKRGEATIKRIPLDGQFILCLADRPDGTRAEKKGFALVLARDDVEGVISWEWFNVDQEDHATKLQESGQLGIKVGEVGPAWEVTRTEFLSPVSLRAALIGEDPPAKPRWRVKIAQGSAVRWPSLVDGKLVVP